MKRSLAKVWVFLLVLLGYLGGRYLPMPVKCFVNPERIQLLPEAEPTGGNSGFLPSGVCLEQVSGVQPDKRTIYRLEVIVPKSAANDRLHVSSIDAIDGVR